MLLLMAFLERDRDNENLRTYQRDRWGMLSRGETCVIELSGLPAHNLQTPRDRESFRPERIEIIRQRMHTHRPALVIMYGLREEEKRHWEEIAPLESTTIEFTPHPTSYGLTNAYWVKLGERLRRQVASRS